jgi:hypothetical protein
VDGDFADHRPGIQQLRTGDAVFKWKNDRHAIPPSGTNLLHPPFTFELGSFTPGTLQAVCLIGGRQKAVFTRKTSGAAAALRLTPEGADLLADGSDARLVFIDIVDAEGTVVWSNDGDVDLAVSGPGGIVGPATVTMKGGQLAVWVRGSRTPGTVTRTAEAPGLTPASLSLISRPVSGLPPAPADRTALFICVMFGKRGRLHA